MGGVGVGRLGVVGVGAGTAGAALGLAANVGLEEELAEEDKVAEVHERGPDDVVHVRGTLLALLHPGVDQVVDHAAHHHLGDLRQRDEHGELAGHLEAGRPQRVVGVHDRVHQVVHGHEPAPAGHHVLVGVPGVEQHSDVVVPMQEDQLLFPQDDEQSIAWGDGERNTRGEKKKQKRDRGHSREGTGESERSLAAAGEGEGHRRELKLWTVDCQNARMSQREGFGRSYKSGVWEQVKVMQCE